MRAKHTLGFTFALVLAAACVSRGRAGEIAKPTVDLSVYGHVSQIVWIAKDLDPVLDYWGKLGLKKIDRSNVREFTGLIYRGKPAPTTARYAFGRVGDTFVEWIQPATGDNLYTEFLKRHGDGILALGYAVKTEGELERQIQYFQSKGVEVAQRTEWKNANGTGHDAHLDTAAKGGGLTIVLYHDPDGPAPTEVRGPENEFPFSRLSHYAYVVRSDREVVDYWQELGFGGMQIDHNVSVDRMHRGRPTDYLMDIAWQHFGDPPTEYIQSTKGPNLYEEYMRIHGEGLHHMAVIVKDMDAAAKICAGKGAPRVMWGGWDTPQSKGRFAYLDTDPHGGVTLELIWNQPMPK